MTKKKDLTCDYFDWSVTFELLMLEEYEQVAELLYELQVVTERKGEVLQADIFGCRPSKSAWPVNQCKADILWHQQAYEKSRSTGI